MAKLDKSTGVVCFVFCCFLKRSVLTYNYNQHRVLNHVREKRPLLTYLVLILITYCLLIFPILSLFIY